MSLNLVLGHSVRTAQTAMERGKDASIVCLVSPSPRAERRMGDREMIEVFDCMGKIVTKVQRLEIHYYACNRIWLPAKAMTAFLRASAGLGKERCELSYMLLNGMRFSGPTEDLVELGLAFKDHPTLARICMFNVASLTPLVTPLNPVMEAMRLNPVLKDVAFRYNNWTSSNLVKFCDEQGKNTTLRLTGKEAFGKEGIDMPPMMHSLKFNTCLKELRVNQCPAIQGCGHIISDMLESNKTLDTLMMELSSFQDMLPIAKVLERQNKTIKSVDLFVTCPRYRSRNNRFRVNHPGRGADTGNMSDSDEEDQMDINEDPDIKAALAAFEKTLETNFKLEALVLNTPGSNHTSALIDLMLKFNRNGRQEILQNERVTPLEVVGFLERNSADVALVYNLLRTKPPLIHILTQDQDVQDTKVASKAVAYGGKRARSYKARVSRCVRSRR